ncbi:MAG: hypothetical protein ABIV21_04260 [Pyrinomonadaceae bacterium]
MFRTIALLFIIAATYCVTANAQIADSWRAFRSDKGKFSVKVPCKMDLEVKKADPKDPNDIDQIYHSCDAAAGYFAVIYVDFKIVLDDKSMLDTYSGGLTEGSTLVSQKDIKLGRLPGRELVLTKNQNGVDLKFRWRVYLKGKRLYALTVGTEASAAASPDVTKFLTSFTVLK